MEGIDQVNLLPHLQVIAFSLVVFFCVNYIASYNGYYKLPNDDESLLNDTSALTFLKLLGIFAVFFISNILVVSSIKIYLLLKEHIPFFKDIPLEAKFNPSFMGWIDLIFIVFSLITLVFYSFLLGRPTCKAFAGIHFFDSKRRLRDLGIGVASILICYPLVTSVNESIGVIFDFFQIPSVEQVPVEKVRLIMQDRTLFLFTSLGVLFIVPAAEEILFRGYLQTWITNTLGRATAIILTSAIFAAFHYADKQGVRNIQIVGTLFVFSLFLSFVKERQQSLWASIGLHTTFNAIALSAIFLGA